MRVNLKGQVTEADVKRLGEIARELKTLFTGLHPSAPCAQAAMLVLYAVAQCRVEWTGDPMANVRPHGSNGARS